MVDRIEWFKRQFSFELPVWMYPNVVERLRGTPARLEDLTHGLSQEILTRREDDKWSIQEQAGHLLDLEPLGMNRLDDYEAGRETLYDRNGLSVSSRSSFRCGCIRTSLSVCAELLQGWKT